MIFTGRDTTTEISNYSECVVGINTWYSDEDDENDSVEKTEIMILTTLSTCIEITRNSGKKVKNNANRKSTFELIKKTA
jgi:hypothetical protein